VHARDIRPGSECCHANYARLPDTMEAARTRFRSLNAIPAGLFMLRRVVNLLTLYVCLLLAGIPTMVCADADAMQECCPSVTGAPCQGGGADAPRETSTDLACCASGVQSPTATMTAALLRIEHPAPHSDPPIAINAYSSPTVSSENSGSNIAIAFVSRLPSFSTLYLSTGRLRL